MASLFDVFGRLLLDDGQFQADAVRAGEKASDNIAKTTSARLKSGLGTAAKIGFGALAAGAAVVTGDLVKLDNVMAKFTADTGATADEAERARKSIIALSGRNLQGIEEIGNVMAVLKTNMGLVGDEAEITADSFLKFARITGRDAASEVAAFDDVLDAWGMTAEDIPRIMDLAVASHQRFGTSITGNIDALARMAPQLKTLNLGLDDGVALLNLFADSGLDAAMIPRALNTALQKLNGQSFPDFLAELGAIEDPAARAARAIEIFGSKAGVNLANAIQPGVTSLEAYKNSEEEIAGAAPKAADAILTLQQKIELFFNNFRGSLLGIADEFGPLATGLASAFSLGGALGLGRLAKNLIGGIGAVGVQAGGALVDGMAVAVGGAGTVVGNILARVIDPTEKAFGNPLRRVAAAAGALWSRIFAGAMAVAEAFTSLFLKLPFIPALRGAILGSAIKMGTLGGSRMALAFKVALIAGVVLLGKDIVDQFNQDIEDQKERWKAIGATAASAIAEGNLEELKRQRQHISDEIALLTTPATGFDPLKAFRTLFSQGELDKLLSDLDSINAEIATLEGGEKAASAATDDHTQSIHDQLTALGYTEDQIVQLAGDTEALNLILGETGASGEKGAEQVRDAFGVLVPAIDAGADAWAQYRQESRDAQQQALSDQLDFTSSALSDLIAFQTGVEQALSGVYNAETDAQVTKNRIIILEKELHDARKEFVKKGAKVSKAEIAEYENRRIGIEGELMELKLHSALIGSDMQRLMKLQSILTSQEMKDGLTSENDNTAAAYRDFRGRILAYIDDIANKGGPAAERAARVIAGELNPNSPSSPLANARSWGLAVGNAYASGIAAALAYAVGHAIADALRQMANFLRSGSPPKDPRNPLHHIDDWGTATGEAFVSPMADALRQGIGSVKSALSAYSLPAAPLGGLAPMATLGSAGIASALAGTAGMTSNVGDVVVNGGIHVDARGAKDPQATAEATKQGIADAMADILRGQTARLPVGTRS